jgi:hypothetical protein
MQKDLSNIRRIGLTKHIICSAPVKELPPAIQAHGKSSCRHGKAAWMSESNDT